MLCPMYTWNLTIIHVHVHVYTCVCFVFVCVDSYHTPPLLLFPLPPAIHTHQVWSLSSVKVALSHLHWQREKVLRSDTPLHLKIGSTLMEVVGAAFHLKPDKLFNRTRMVKSLLSQQKRGAVSGHTHTPTHSAYLWATLILVQGIMHNYTYVCIHVCRYLIFITV